MAKYLNNLLWTELRHKPDQELVIVIQNRDTECLEDMFQAHLLFNRRLDHRMQRVLHLLLGIEMSLDNLDEHVRQGAVIDPVQLLKVNPPIGLLQLHLSQQEVILQVLN